MIGEVLTHLWQSTFFALGAWLLAFALRGNRASARFNLWLAASLKFFVPFALLINLGSQIHWTPAAHEIATQYASPAVAFAVDSVAEPFGRVSPITPARPQGPVDWAVIACLSLWIAGFLTVAVIRLRLWLRIRRIVRASTAMETPAPVAIRSAHGLLEPGVVGIRKPVLLLPAGIADRLAPTELEAVIAHEICHVRRRDNLFAGIHMIVEAVFWFHPLVWWIGARMVEERERACDEDVLNLGNSPRVYADAILGVCRLYAESPLVCVSGVTGSNIRRRIEAIMKNHRGRTLNRGRKALLAAAGALALGGPMIVGVLISFGQLPEIHAQAPATPPVTPLAVTAVAQAAVPDATPAAAPSQDRRLIVMLFDFTGTTADQQYRAKVSAVGYLANQKQPDDVISVMSVSSGTLQVLQDFTADGAALNATIQNIKGVPAGTPSADGLANIETVARMVKAFPQKKTLLLYANWIGADSAAATQHAIDAAIGSNLAIVPIDIKGDSPGGPGRGMLSPTAPTGVSPDEYARRVAYAQSTFGAKNPMAISYARYGAPDQIEDRGTAEVWRYRYLDDYQGGAAFEFTKGSFPRVHILYPQPQATYEGNAANPGEVAQLTGGLRGGADASNIKSGLPGPHSWIQVYSVAPGVAPAPDRRFVPISIPLDSLSGAVELVAQVRTRVESPQSGQMIANLADSPQAAPGAYQSAFTLRPGAYICKVLVREASTGRMFGEVINFDVN
ncbi:MAG TPA: M56 family metallopeptidase [Bryobacteraceae bacterium]|nr:M56 family metallopeptidase [Bryobacteraceae bacterium]